MEGPFDQCRAKALDFIGSLDTVVTVAEEFLDRPSKVVGTVQRTQRFTHCWRSARLSPYLHPEFGGFCPGSRLRRDLRIVAFSVLFGVTTGAVGVIGLRASHSPATPVDVISSDARVGDTTQEGRLAEGSNGQASGAIQNDGRTGILSSRDGGDTKQSNSACPSANSRGDCSFFKQRSVRVRAINDGPDTARIALGRTAAPPAEGTPATRLALPGSPSSPKDPVQEEAPGAASVQQKSAEEPPQSISQGQLKKRQKTARREKRQRNERGNDYSGPADPWAARAESNYGSMSRSYSREASYGRRGFWSWSW